MILNRTGAEFEYEGVTYTIGGEPLSESLRVNTQGFMAE